MYLRIVTIPKSFRVTDETSQHTAQQNREDQAFAQKYDQLPGANQVKTKQQLRRVE